MTILLVDDDAGILKSATRVLKLEGHDVITAHTAEEGLQKFREGPDIDTVITDHTLTHMTGLGLIKELRKLNKSVRIILWSGNLTNLIRREARLLGANDSIDKPFTRCELLAALAS